MPLTPLVYAPAFMMRRFRLFFASV